MSRQPLAVAMAAFEQARGPRPELPCVPSDFYAEHHPDDAALEFAKLHASYSELRKLVQAAINNGALVSGHADSAALCRAVGRAEV